MANIGNPTIAFANLFSGDDIKNVSLRTVVVDFKIMNMAPLAVIHPSMNFIEISDITNVMGDSRVDT